MGIWKTHFLKFSQINNLKKMNFFTILITGYCLVFAYGNTLSDNYRLRNHKRSFMGSDKFYKSSWIQKVLDRASNKLSKFVTRSDALPSIELIDFPTNQ